jgi:hypothetical protein
VPFTEVSGSEKLFLPDTLGNRFDRFLVDIGMIVSGYREGGFFIVIAKKPTKGSAAAEAPRRKTS